MEKTFPGVVVFIACRDDCLYLLKDEPRILSKTQLKDSKNMFGYVRELLCDMQTHPVEEFMKESEIPCGPVVRANHTNGHTVLLTNGTIPVKSLNANQIKAAIDYVRSQGQEPILNEDVSNAGWVIGVECEQLYIAASAGKKITLIPTGFGENLFKNMFPDSEIKHLGF